MQDTNCEVKHTKYLQCNYPNGGLFKNPFVRNFVPADS